ncbi:MAG: hypothetical protein J5365_08545 [Erysipelotrichaceae bacterium]|nr:hypothetical protein [Erysipelotrichaceae bacterium]
MDLVRVKKSLQEFIVEKGMKLFEVSYHKKDATLSVLLDEKLNMDELEKISQEISEHLDQFEDEFDDNYLLDVSTVGAERPIRNEQELLEAIGAYIYVKTKEKEYYGTLKSFEEGKLLLETKDKTRTKDISVDYSQIKKMRYAVQF